MHGCCKHDIEFILINQHTKKHTKGQLYVSIRSNVQNKAAVNLVPQFRARR